MVADPFAAWQRERVKDRLLTEVFGLIDGRHWARAEARFRSREDSQRAIEDLGLAVAAGPREHGIERDLVGLHGATRDLLPRDRALRLAPLLEPLCQGKVYREWAGTGSHLTDDAAKSDGIAALRAWRAEFALRLASAPETLRPWAGDRLDEGLRFLLATPAVARAARFLVLASERAWEDRWEW